jgi:hypothetical protein
MKQRYPLTTVFIAFAFFFSSEHGFGQQQSPTLSELSSDLSELAQDMAGASAFMATIGLNWADAYIGQLIDFPPHWGIGLTLGATTLKLDNLNTLLGKFGYESAEILSSNQLLPAYIIEARLGGIRNAPFDIGVKWGWLPYTPLFADSINYEVNVYGLDFRWQLFQDRFNFPAISIGLEIDRATGGLRRASSLTVARNGGDDIIINGGTAGVVWDAWVFDLKLMVSKKFWQPRLDIFGGLRLGAAITKTGYQFTDGGSISIGGASLGDMSGDQRTSLQSALQSEARNGTTFEVTEDSITGWIDAIGFNFSIYEGISIRFTNMTNLTVSFMADIIHFEMGANISFKYQQQ